MPPVSLSHPPPPAWQAHQAAFVTTHWSVVLAAGQRESPGAAEALEKLCRTYWYPLYAYMRRRGLTPEDAQDSVQSFISGLVTGDSLGGVAPQKGRFRTFLLTAANHFLANQWRASSAIKRGGNVSFVPLGDAGPEDLYQAEPTTDATPESLYERRCALALLDLTLEQLNHEAQSADKSELFEILKPFITDKTDSGDYPAIAIRLGMSEVAVRVAVHRLRHRYGEKLRAEIAKTVTDPADVAAELRYFLTLFG
jgi:DNA-directed RNA polymerase specialized sigma24 family protein